MNLLEELELTINTLQFSGVDHLNRNRDFSRQLLGDISVIKKKLIQRFCTEDAHFTKIIVLHYGSLLRMLERLLELIHTSILQKKECSVDRKEFLLILYHQLNELFEFFHEHFETYIPRHQVFPELFRKPYVAEVKDYLECLTKLLDPETDKKLRVLILEPFISFADHGLCTWQQLFYCRLLYQKFSNLFQEKLFPGSSDLIWLLYSVNFNSVSFYEYFTAYISENQSQRNAMDFYYFQKKCRQAYVKPDVAYQPEERSLSEMVLKWLKEEIRYLEQTKKCTHAIGEELGPTDPGATASKILTNLSVAEFAYLNRVMSEADIFKIDNRKDFCEIVAKSYRTNNKERISSDSLRSKLYTVDSSVKSSVKERLIGMLNYVNRDPA